MRFNLVQHVKLSGEAKMIKKSPMPLLIAIVLGSYTGLVLLDDTSNEDYTAGVEDTKTIIFNKIFDDCFDAHTNINAADVNLFEFDPKEFQRVVSKCSLYASDMVGD